MKTLYPENNYVGKQQCIIALINDNAFLLGFDYDELT